MRLLPHVCVLLTISLILLLLTTHLFTEPRRAAVALIIRVVPSPLSPHIVPPQLAQPTLTEFFDFDWVNHRGARPEILFLRRENSTGDDASLINGRLRNTREAHVAFPGGRMEEGDEGGLYTGTKNNNN